MCEFVKIVSALVVVAGFVATTAAWAEDRPSQTTWLFRFAMPAMAAVALAIFLRINFRGDLVPDYLHRTAGKYFDRRGFCFAVATTIHAGCCFLIVPFQSRYERRCRGQVVLELPKGLFRKRNDSDAITLDIECAPAAFGIATIPVAVPPEIQGKRFVYEVRASVAFPEGQGRMLRFRDGVVIRTDPSGFLRDLYRAMKILAATPRSLACQNACDRDALAAARCGRPAFKAHRAANHNALEAG